VIEKTYKPMPDAEAPKIVVGKESAVKPVR
jgi:hypothetical protein